MATKNPLDEDKLAGNASDSRNASQNAYNRRFNKIRKAEEDADFDQIIANNYGSGAKDKKVDAHGDTVMTNYNADDEDTEAEIEVDDVRQREESGDNKSSFFRAGSDSPYQGNDLKSRLLRMRGVKNKGATTGAAASLLFVGGIMISMAGGSSFWAALEKNLTNDGNDDARISWIMHRAFNNMFKVDACAKPGSLKCKFKTMTKTQVQKFKDGMAKIKGSIVDRNGNPVRGSPAVGNDGIIDPDKMEDGQRVVRESVVFNDGYEARTVGEMNTHMDKSVSARSLMARGVDVMRGSFLHGRFGEMLSKKYGINKTRATPEERRTNQAKTIAADEAKKAMDTQRQGVTGTLFKALMSPSAAVATAGIDYACMLYNATRITVGAVKAKWATDLIRFSWPFVRLVSKIQDGSATEADFKEIEERFMQLVDYMPESRADELKEKIDNNTIEEADLKTMELYGVSTDDLDKRDGKNNAKKQIDEITGKNALDSQGLQAAIYGDLKALSDFSKKFSVGIVGSTTLTMDYIVKQVQRFVGFGNKLEGKRNIRSLCILNKAVGAAQAAGGIAESGIDIVNCISSAGGNVTGFVSCAKLATKMAVKMSIYMSAYIAVGYLMTSAVTAMIIKNAPVLPLDLKGPAAGNALASGIALMLAHKAQSSGLKPAMSMAAVNAFIASTQDTYDAYTTEIAQYEARQAPFDASNRYSFMGQIKNALSPYPLNPNKPTTAFSYMANIFGVVSSLFSNTARAFHSQPSLMTITDAQLQSRLNGGVCESDEEKVIEGMMCDRTSGRTVQVVSPRVIKWAEEDAAGVSDHLSEAIEWMQEAQNRPEAENGGGTKDETCNRLTDALSLDFGSMGTCKDSGEKASIDDEGKPVKGSQFEKFILYCTDQREREMGSTDLDTSIGSTKEQDWHSGKQCGKTYDSNGTPSSDTDAFDPSKDTGKGSLMMDYFFYYYHMCYVQYAVANNATDCTNDTPPNATASGGSVGAGNGDIAASARMMGEWGAQYNSCYVYGGGHGRDRAWMEAAIQNHFAGDYAVDCSAFVRAVILHATGNDIGDQTTHTMCADTQNFERVPRDQAQPGDLAIDCANHVEVIVDPNGGDFKTVGSHTTGCGPGMGSSPGTYQGTESFVLRYKGG